MAAYQNPESGPGSSGAQDRVPAKQEVLQPEKAAGLEMILGEIDQGEVREQTGEDRSGDWSGAAGQLASGQQGEDSQRSPREIALRSLPSQKVMRSEIAKHIKTEIRHLRKETRKIVRIGKPGDAYSVAQLYRRIRQLASLLSQVTTASVEVVRRLFVKIFIDKQAVL